MSSRKYEPYRKTKISELKDNKYKDEWFDYDPYAKDRTNTKPYEAYNLNYNPLIHKEPIWSKESIKVKASPKFNRFFRFSFLWNIMEQFFADIKFAITDVAEVVFKQFKLKK